jgi:hypothetical protein
VKLRVLQRVDRFDRLNIAASNPVRMPRLIPVQPTAA